MTNSILKSFLKKLIKSEAFVSVIIVFVLAIGIIGTSYALYMDVDTDTNYQLVEVGDLSIGFDNGDNTIKLTNMTPTDDEIAKTQNDNLFSFYIYNTGKYTANYDIKLVTENGNTIGSEYINYQICKDNSDNCKDIKTLSDVKDRIIYKDELSPNKTTDQTNPSSYYFLRVWINNKYNADGEIKENGKVVLKIIIEAKNASGYLDNKNTLAGAILNNPNITINNNIPDFSTIADYKVTGDSTSGEPGLYKAEDDYGISYYFRGAQSNNFVNFAGHTWRIVRINGDGSVRLILNTAAGIGTSFSSSSCRGKYCLGYMLGNEENDFSNINDSTIKTEIDKWYEDNNLDDYKEYLSDTIFCGDKSFEGTTNTLKNNIRDTKSTPTLKCDNESESNYSRYTVDRHNINGIETNGDLKYPIALLSVDELMLAGAKTGVANNNIYLSLGGTFWWTMSASYHDTNYNIPWIYQFASGKIVSSASTNGEGTYFIRPVINLKADVLVDDGTGTELEPYTVKLS